MKQEEMQLFVLICAFLAIFFGTITDLAFFLFVLALVLAWFGGKGGDNRYDP